MAVERRDPVPPGRYSIFLNTDEFEDFFEWLDEHQGAVQVVAAVEKLRLEDDSSSALAPVFSTSWTGRILQNSAGSILLFDVLAPTPWVGFGFPTIETGLSVSAFAARETENPEFIPEKTPVDELKGLALLGGALYLGTILFSKVFR